MAKTTITYLDPTADERDISHQYVLTLDVEGDITLQNSFISIYDKKKLQTKYYAHHRILQIDVRFSKEEQLAAIRKYRSIKKAVVYYLKVFIEEKTQYTYQIQNFGDKPFGLECSLIEAGEFWTRVLVPSFAAMIIIPTSRVLGINELDNEDADMPKV